MLPKASLEAKSVDDFYAALKTEDAFFANLKDQAAKKPAKKYYAI
jgi:aspartokinase/homoserine dehydrogenase 1